MRKPIYDRRPEPASVAVPGGQDAREVDVARTLFCGEVAGDCILICQLADGRYYLDNDGDVQVFPDRTSLAEYLWAGGNITWRLWQTFYDMPDGFVTLDWAALRAADRQDRLLAEAVGSGFVGKPEPALRGKMDTMSSAPGGFPEPEQGLVMADPFAALPVLQPAFEAQRLLVLHLRMRISETYSVIRDFFVAFKKSSGRGPIPTGTAVIGLWRLDLGGFAARCDWIEISSEFRRRGFGTELYAGIEAFTGWTIDTQGTFEPFEEAIVAARQRRAGGEVQMTLLSPRDMRLP